MLEQENLKIESVMTPEPATISEDASVEWAAKLLRMRKINALPVLSKNNELVGIITVTDVFDGLLNLLRIHEEPQRIQVILPEGVELYDVIKLFQTYSEKVLSFSTSDEEKRTCYFWVSNCDFDKLSTKFKERGLNVRIIHQ